MALKSQTVNIRFRRNILSNKRLKDEIIIALGLILLAVLVLVGYLFPGSTSFFDSRASLPVILGISFVIFAFGFLIIVQIIEPLIKITRQAGIMAKGDISTRIQTWRNDELGDLGQSINQLTATIRDNVEELKQLGNKTDALNQEINTRISMLSRVMEISGGLAQNLPFDDILKCVVDHCLSAYRMTFACVILRDRITDEYKIYYLDSSNLATLMSHGMENIKIHLGKGFLGKALLRNEPYFIDRNTAKNDEISDFLELFMIKNAIAAPIVAKGKSYGLLIGGNEIENHEFSSIDREMISLISKNLAIAILNDMLSRDLQKFEMIDQATGLFNNRYARQQFPQAIKEAVAEQKSCSFLLIRVRDFKEYLNRFGQNKGDQALLRIASLLRNRVSAEIRICRFDLADFAFILPGRSKKQAIEIGNDIVDTVNQGFSRERDILDRLKCIAAVVENPIDGVDAEELILKCEVLLGETVIKNGLRVGFI